MIGDDSSSNSVRLFSFLACSDDDPNDVNQNRNRGETNSLPGPPVGANPFLEISQNIPTVEYKKGYVMRKCCVDSNNKKSELNVADVFGVGGLLVMENALLFFL